MPLTHEIKNVKYPKQLGSFLRLLHLVRNVLQDNHYYYISKHKCDSSNVNDFNFVDFMVLRVLRATILILPPNNFSSLLLLKIFFLINSSKQYFYLYLFYCFWLFGFPNARNRIISEFQCLNCNVV